MPTIYRFLCHVALIISSHVLREKGSHSSSSSSRKMLGRRWSSSTGMLSMAGCCTSSLLGGSPAHREQKPSVTLQGALPSSRLLICRFAARVPIEHPVAASSTTSAALGIGADWARVGNKWRLLYKSTFPNLTYLSVSRVTSQKLPSCRNEAMDNHQTNALLHAKEGTERETSKG